MHLLPRVFRSEGDVVDFNPDKILESIKKETGMPDQEAKRITELVVRRIISTGMKFLSGPHIREIVCSILSEQHFEEERKLYTRIGMPLMDYEDFLENAPECINPEKVHHWAANQLAEEYSHLRLLSSEQSKAHLYGDLHVHDLKYFDLRPQAQFWDPRLILKNGLPPGKYRSNCCKSGPAGSLNVAANHLSKWLGMMQGEFSGEQGFWSIATFLAPYARNLSQDKVKQGVQSLIYEINQLSALVGRDAPVTSLSYSPVILEELRGIKAIGNHGKNQGLYGDYQDECLAIFNAFSEIFLQGDYLGNPFQFPKQFIHVGLEWMNAHGPAFDAVEEQIMKNNSICLVNATNSNIKKRIIPDNVADPGLRAQNFGTLQQVTINLPRCAYLSKNEDEFYEILREKMKLGIQILEKKLEIIQKRMETQHLPLCTQIIDEKPLLILQHQDLGLSFTGLDETVKALTGTALYESESSLNLGVSIANFFVKECETWSLEHSTRIIPQENLSEIAPERFFRLDIQHFSEECSRQMRDGKEKYTSFAFIPPSESKNIIDMIKKQAIFHELMPRGATLEMPLDSCTDAASPLRSFIKEAFRASNIARIAFY